MLLAYIVRRVLWAIPFLIAVSLVAFALIQAPPGDYITTFAATLAASGDIVDQDRLDALRERYGLDQPFLVQYWKWISGVLQGDFGMSFEWQQPLVLMYIAVVHFGADVSGLFSPEYQNAPWSWGKLLDLLAHLWIPVIILGTSASASLIRIMRANLLDELNKPYVTTARAKGLSELRLILKYPVRLALNPFVSTIGWAFPQLISGAVITAFVLSLPTAGPLLLQALLAQDMYLAGAFILLLCSLTVVGMLVSDILLAIVDPRIRYR